MNKLVLKNPVQRFKQGRKIIKAQYSWGPGFGIGNLSDKKDKQQIHKQHKIDDATNKLLTTVKNPTPFQQAEFNREYNKNPSIVGPYLNHSLNNDYYFGGWESEDIGNNYSGLVGDFHYSREKAYNDALGMLTNNRFLIEKESSPVPLDSKNSYAASGQQFKSNNSAQGGVETNVSYSQKKSTNNKNSFKQAFNKARNLGLKEFTWGGRRFNTMKAGETKDQWLSNLKPQTQQNNSLINQVKFVTPSIEENSGPILSTPIIPQSEYTFTESQLQGLGKNPYYEPHPELRFNNFDRTQTRQWLRDNGFNPYSLTGAQRKALRMILNGQGTDEDKNLIGLTGGLTELLNKYNYLKKGGNLLPSRNIVERFKSSFRKVAQ